MKSAVFNGDEARRRLYLRGMQGQQLAEAVGVSTASISSYLTGKRRPSPPVFLRICKALEAKPNELYVEDADASSTTEPTGNAA
ncbi:helix-turn-helix transcriptional regulator [Streptomyces sp. NPDC048110]|uniref:helix-turn-helix domain-containing protein n=1 Tax=Streptomyces sp. NPDC048110 TaxID=3155483 RepID=UPI0033CF9B06